MAVGKFNDPKSYALKLLSIRMRSETELRRRLRKRGFKEDEIERTIRELKDAGLINDREFAEAFYESKSKKLWSSTLIVYHLKRFGISDEIIEEILKCREDKDFKGEIVEKMRGMMERWSVKNEMKRREKLYNYLRRRGYSHSFVMDILRELLNN
jgi:regulatory protein